MSSVKPIQTRYKGYRFRSRLEARWAVFFDTAEIAYEYELEGFSLPSGAAYLPDFYLPQFDLHVEVKPSERIPLVDLRKITEFALQGDRHVLLIAGTPTNETMFLINRNHDPLIGEMELELGGSEDDVVSAVFESLRTWSVVTFGNTPLNRKSEWVLIYREAPPYPLLWQAMCKAKEARFEHGESG